MREDGDDIIDVIDVVELERRWPAKGEAE